MSTWPKWSGSKLPGINTVVMCAQTVTRARLLPVDALEERHPGAAVALAACRLPAELRQSLQRLQSVARLRHDDGRPNRRQQTRPRVEVVRRVGEHDVGVDGGGLAECVRSEHSAATREAQLLDVAAQNAYDVAIAFDERAVVGAPRERLDTQR